MGRRSRRAVYDPSIIDRVDDMHMQSLDCAGPDPLMYDNIEPQVGMDDEIYESPETEILDPNFHNLPRTQNHRCRKMCLIGLVVAGLIAIIVTVSVAVAQKKAASAAISAVEAAGTSFVDGTDSTGGGSTAITLAPASEYIVEWCTGTQKDIESIKNLCLDECSKATCCWSLDGEAVPSCSDNERCPEYAPCLALSAAPTFRLTSAPSIAPVQVGTATSAPTLMPTLVPSKEPTSLPLTNSAPTNMPANVPTNAPNPVPVAAVSMPTMAPVNSPSPPTFFQPVVPTFAPIFYYPTNAPNLSPSGF